jgi:hypothetical protein
MRKRGASIKIRNIEKIDLREYWEKEDKDFTPWLAQPENIKILSDTIGIDMEVEGQEESVGPFSADILCKDTTNNHYILIENQLTKTDHTHLGQLITYAAGLDAVTIIWIAKNFNDEHRAALDWLNGITEENFNFFGIEIELYKISRTEAAPLFKIVSKPNDWSKQVKKGRNVSELTVIKNLQYEYWKALKDYLNNTKSTIKTQSPRPQHWLNISIGKTGYHIAAQVNSREKLIGIWLLILGENHKENYDKLRKKAAKESIKKISSKIEWERQNENIRSVIMLKKDANIADKNDWENQFKWFKEYLEKYVHFFKPIIAEL